MANFEMFMGPPKARENIFAAVMRKILYYLDDYFKKICQKSAQILEICGTFDV